MSVKENMELMKTLDDAWNSQDWETFNKRHAQNVAVYWPDGKMIQPTNKTAKLEFCTVALGKIRKLEKSAFSTM